MSSGEVARQSAPHLPLQASPLPITANNLQHRSNQNPFPCLSQQSPNAQSPETSKSVNEDQAALPSSNARQFGIEQSSNGVYLQTPTTSTDKTDRILTTPEYSDMTAATSSSTCITTRSKLGNILNSKDSGFSKSRENRQSRKIASQVEERLAMCHQKQSSVQCFRQTTWSSLKLWIDSALLSSLPLTDVTETSTWASQNQGKHFLWPHGKSKTKWTNSVLVFFLLLLPTAFSQFTELAFTKESYNVSIQENCLPRTYVRGEELMGVSLENLPISSRIHYTITSGDREGFFAVEDEEVGGVSVLHMRTKTGLRDVLNRERKSRYTLEILAEARSLHNAVTSLTASTVVRITIEDTNDNIPLFYPDSYSIAAPEDLLLNSPLVNVKAQDADSGINGQVYYYLADSSTNLFSVHPTSGLVSLTRSLHPSHSTKFRLKVLASDRGSGVLLREGAIAQANVEISVLRMNNASPRITVRHLPHVVEHAHAHIYAIMTVTDTDEGPSGTISLVEIIDGDPDRVFSIARGSNENEYNLIVLKLLDRELAPTGYNLTVRATDRGRPSRSTEIGLFVDIADINDHFPVFLQEQYEEVVNEEAPPNTPIVRVTASDTDLGKNGIVTFRILAGNSDRKFKINPVTGLISTTNWLDAEAKAYYSLTIAAIDQASSAVRKQSSAKVTIRILDSNDNAPGFTTKETEVTIDENEPAGSYVMRVSASDEDSSENGFVSYSLANKNQVPFTIDPFDGVIRTSKLLDFETGKRTYILRVRASDWGQPFKRETETTIRVILRDVNDNRPQFLNTGCSGWLPSSTPKGSAIVSLKAIDMDARSAISYRLVGPDEQRCWSLDRNSGTLALNCNLKSSFLRSLRSRTVNVNITATDGRYMSDPASITLTVVDDHYNEDPSLFNGHQVKCSPSDVAIEHLNAEVSSRDNNAGSDSYLGDTEPTFTYNVHSPKFSDETPNTFDVLESVQVGTELFTLSATDNDYGYDGRVVYAITSGDMDSVFEINMVTGVVSVAAQLDRERTALYELNITAYDVGLPHQSASTNVTIKVIDANDNPPQFTRISYHLHLPENTKNATSVAQLLAIDPDEGANAEVSYELVTDVDEFSVDPVSGIIYITKPLDRERVGQYELRVRAWDNGKLEQRYSVTRVFVTVLDINDCAPDFGAAKYVTVSVPEDYPVGTVVATMQATDRDLGAGGMVTFSIQEDRYGVFRIDPETGIVRISATLDFEKDQLYNLTIRAEDGGSPALHTNAQLIVYVQDVDESKGSPSFLQRIVIGRIRENEPAGTLVLTLAITNPDARPLQYAVIGGGGHGYFSVNRHGEVRSLRPLDRETDTGYWLTIRAWAPSALADASDTCWVYVEVEDVNDHAPQTTEPSYRVYVPEDASQGTSVLKLLATDGDLKSTFWSDPNSGGSASGAGNERGGQRERGGVLGALEGSIRFFIRSVRGRRNTEALTSVLGEEGWGPDTDGGELFTVNRETGVLSTAGPLDREFRSQYEVQVIVTDGDLWTVTPVYVTVSDVNDNAPRFLENIYRVTVPERRQQRRRQPLVRVYAKDLDSGANADLSYSIKGNKAKGLFKIHTKTGMIMTKAELRAEESHDILVEVRDSGRPQRVSSTRVLLRVAAVPASSHTPLTVLPPSPAHLMETDPPGHLVTFITASGHDDDTVLWYYITGGDNSARFSVGVDTGLVAVAKPLDRELQSHYTLTIAVTDGVQTTHTELFVDILDSNDHSPVFSAPVYPVTISEDSAPGTSILTLLCRDKDHVEVTHPTARTTEAMDHNEEDNLLEDSSLEQRDEPPPDTGFATPLYFSFQHTEAADSEGLFALDTTTGVLSVAQPLDREVSPRHLLTVACRDRGARANADYARVAVTVTDTNDHWPVFSEEHVTATVPAGAAPGAEIVRLMAIDGDSGDNGRLTYVIAEGNSEGLFSIDPSLGIIRAAGRFSDKTSLTDEHTLLVKATDHAPEPRSASVPVRIRVTVARDAPPTWEKAPPVSGPDAPPTWAPPTRTQAGQIIEVSEWAPRGTAVAIATATAPKTALHYSITGGDISEDEKTEGTFLVTPSSGVVSLAAVLDRETCSWYNLTITATNAVGVSKSTWVGIKVLDENDWSPVWDEYEYHGIVLETAEVGDPVLEYPKASSSSLPDTKGPHQGTNLHYRTKRGSPNNHLTKRQSFKAVNLSQLLPRNPPYRGTAATASSTESTFAADSIRELPVFRPLAVTASDQDTGPNSRLSYTMAERSSAAIFFKLDPITGAVRVAGDLSTMAGRTMKFNVWVSDDGDPSLSSLSPAVVSVVIEKANLFPPRFSKDTYEANIHLPTIPGVEVICLEASDPDDQRGRNITLWKSRFYRPQERTQLVYSLKQASEDYKSNYRIDRNSGCLFVNDVNIVKGKHKITVLVSDGTFTSSSDVVVFVSDPVETSLKFSQNRYFAHVHENSTKQFNLLVVRVEDLPPHQHVMYSVLNPNDYLEIKPTSGVIRTTGKPFDRELREHFSLIIQAQETESGRTGNVEVTVAILDVNDNEPVFVGQPYHALLPVAAQAEHVVTQVRAVDIDSGEHGTVRYELVRGSGDLFRVDRDTGKVMLRQPLVAADGVLTLTVAAYDGGTPPLTAQAQVIVRVVSAGGPLFSASVYRATVPEDAVMGTPVTRLVAESPSGAALVYTVVAGDRGEHFALDYGTGVLQVNSPLDFETQRWHNLTVRARDPSVGVYADAVVTVAVTDVNDSPPVFAVPVIKTKVSEAAVPGTVVMKVTATDADTGDSGRVHYSCLLGCEEFAVAGVGGEVVLITRLDADTNLDESIAGGGSVPVAAVRTVVVQATDAGMVPLSATVSVLVTVEDFNDNPPAWTQESFTTSVSPDAAPGQVLTAVAARDPDVSDQGKLTYRIQDGDSGGIFWVDPETGVVSIRSPLRLEGLSVIALNVSVSDGVHAVVAPLTIAVTATNAFAPRFSRKLYEVRIPEDRPPNSTLLRLEALDPDGSTYGLVSFSVLGDKERALFEVDRDGYLVTRAPLDREQDSTHVFVVSATDGGGKADFAKVRILVTDINDNAPEFALPQYQANIRVDTTVGETILKVKASDTDEGRNSSLTFSLYESNSSQAMHMFGLDSNSGHVTLKKSAQGQANEVFQFFIRATDDGSPALHSDVPVTIFLLPSAQQTPSCDRPFARFFLPEDAVTGTVVTSLWVNGPMLVSYSLLSDTRQETEEDYQNPEKRSADAPSQRRRFTNSDSDSSFRPTLPELMWQMEEDVTSKFVVTPSGDVVLRNPLDHESRRSHEITVINQTLSAPPTLDYMTIVVVVMDVNDNAPVFASSSYVTSLAENSAVGATVLVVSATDRDGGKNGQIQFSLSPSTPPSIASMFVVAPTSGAITLAAPMDRETVARYSFTVVATDGGVAPLQTSATVVVNVVDYNDNPPVFGRGSYVVSVPEDATSGHPVFAFTITDADEVHSELDYFVSAGDPSSTFILLKSGQVVVGGPLDRERTEQYVLSVTASDGKFTANTSLTINIMDVNDNGPVCPRPSYRVSVSESVVPGTPVLRVETTDADDSPHDVSRFSLSGAGSELFRVTERMGEISTAGQLDREDTNTHTLTVTASDWSRPEWSCQVTVSVTVTDVNDNPPALERLEFTATIPEDALTNTVVTKIRALDPDLGENRRVSYRLLDSASGHFTMDEKEGLVSLARPLDREVQSRYRLLLEASDHGSPSLKSTASLLVTVADINDNPPEFVRTLLQVAVAENTAVGSEVTRARATSRDIGVNAEITYSLEQGTRPAYLAIHPETGVITIASALDYEKVQSLVVSVMATDGGHPPLSATALLNLTVVDTNDNAPVFALDGYSGRVSEGAPLGEYIAQLSAHDADSGPNGRLSYAITRGDASGRFAVNSRKGALTLAREVDREEVSHFDLEVTVTDAGSPTLSATTSVAVTIGDVNDNPPRFERRHYAAIVQEDKKVGYSVLRLHVTDSDDEGNAAPFTWEIIDVTAATTFVPLTAAFALDQDGVVRLANAELNHKTQNEFFLRVRAWDSGSPPLFSDCTVNITVVERSKYPPTVFPLQVTVYSYRTAYRGGIIGKISALDKDVYDTLEYSVGLQESTSSSYLNGDVDYFDVDGQDGTLVAVTPLDAGLYHVNVTVSDGKFSRTVDVSVDVRVLTQQMVDNAVILKMGPVSPDEFIARYKGILVKSIASELYLSENQIQIISLQSNYHHQSNRTRLVRDISESLDVLLVIAKEKDNFYSRNETMDLLRTKQSRIKRRLLLDRLEVMESVCTSSSECSGNGDCVDLVVLRDDVVMPLNTRLGSVVALRFEHESGCLCHQGFGGEVCQDLVNACGHRPCSEFEVCTPTDLIPKGYLCHCPVGYAGSKCDIDVSKCNNLSCYYPIRPLSFRGKSYAQYSAPHQGETSSMQLSLHLRTRHPVGVISYSAGTVDYSQLEVMDGHIQYRWDCGSGEGVVRVSSKKINDNKWHFVNVTRKGTMSILSLDGEESSSAAPGDNDILNIESDYMYLGAQVTHNHFNPSVEYGFVGCIDEVMLNKARLPLTLTNMNGDKASLKRFVNVELTCPETLPVPGICGSHPCLNGGICAELNRSEFECTCSERYSGKQCEVDEAPCASQPCLNDGVCVVIGHTYSCNCPIKLSGKRCEYGVYCNPNPCQNGGRCEEGSNGPICKCHHFTGERCHRDVDECLQNPCRNGGTCLNFYGGFRCLCQANSSGEYCTDIIATSGLGLSITLEDLFVILAVFIAFALVIIIIVVWQRRRCRKKKHQQNNRVRLTAHVKNDLKAVDHRPHRNSKICNVEADQLHLQYPPLPQRPRSFVSSGDESLKGWAGETVALTSTQEALELDLLSRQTTDAIRDPSDVIHRQASDYVLQDPNFNTACGMSQPNLAKLVAQASQNGNLYLGDQQVVDLSQKPWDHHNNLNDSYFTPVKGTGDPFGAMAVPPAGSPSVASCAVNGSNYLAPEDSPGIRPTTPLTTFRGNSPNPSLQPHSPSLVGEGGDTPKTVVYLPAGVDVQRAFNDCSGRPRQSLDVTRGGVGGVEEALDDTQEARPLLPYSSQQLPEVVLCNRDPSEIPLLRTSDSETQNPSTNALPSNGGVSRSASSFDDLLQANNISLDSSDDAINETPVVNSTKHHPSFNIKYNIVSTEDDDHNNHDHQIDDGEKITNVAPTSLQTLLAPNSKPAYNIPKVRNDRRIRTEPRKRASREGAGNLQATGNQGRLGGNPRSRRPIVRGDYGRVSDLSFISNNTDSEAEPNETVSDFHDSDEGGEGEQTENTSLRHPARRTHSPNVAANNY